MPPQSADTPPRPRLALRVGVTGHRLNRLLQSDADFAGVESSVEEVLSIVWTVVNELHQANTGLYQSDVPPIVRLLSPLAEGADQIVATHARNLGMRLDVPLPFPIDAYVSRFQTPSAPSSYDPRSTFDRLIHSESVESIQVLDGDTATSETRAQAYFQVGNTVVRHSDLLIALWDGAPAQGHGGTAEIVDQARQLSIPIIWINPTSPAHWSILGAEALTRGIADRSQQLTTVVKALLAGPPAAEPSIDDAGSSSLLTDYLATRVRPAFGGIFSMLVKLLAFERPSMPRMLPPARTYQNRTRRSWAKIWSTPTPLPEGMGTRIEGALLPYYAWASGLADRFGTLHRDVFSSMYLLAPLAVLAALFAQFGGAVDPAWSDVMWARVAVLEFLMLAFIVTMYRLDNRGRYHSRWIEYRSLAEHLRQLIFLWPLGRPTRTLQFRGESASEAARFTWISWYCRAVIREIGLFPAVMTPEYLAACKSLLLDRMIGEQLRYHQGTAHRMHRVHHVLHTFANVLFFAAAVVSALHLWHLWTEGHLSWSYLMHGISSLPHNLHELPSRDTHWLGVLAVFLPTVAAAAHGFLSQGDFWNLQRRSERMYHELTSLCTRLETVTSTSAALTSEALGDAAEEASETLDDEVLNWRVFVRLKPISLV